MGVEHHGQGFPAALGMPENAALAICPGGAAGGLHRLFDGKILVIPSKDFECVLAVYIEADKIFDNVKKALFLK